MFFSRSYFANFQIPRKVVNCFGPIFYPVCNTSSESGTDPGGTIAPPKTYQSNFIHHNFVQFGK